MDYAVEESVPAVEPSPPAAVVAPAPAVEPEAAVPYQQPKEEAMQYDEDEWDQAYAEYDGEYEGEYEEYYEQEYKTPRQRWYWAFNRVVQVSLGSTFARSKAPRRKLSTASEPNDITCVLRTMTIWSNICDRNPR